MVSVNKKTTCAICGCYFKDGDRAWFISDGSKLRIVCEECHRGNS